MDARQMIWTLSVALVVSACSASSSEAVGVGETEVPVATAAVEQATPVEVTTADTAAGPVITPLAGRDTVATRFGTVAVLRNQDMGSSHLTYYGDASALAVEMDYVGLIALVRWGDRDAVMYETDCSGSSCGWPNYGLLELGQGAAPQLVQTEGMGFMAADMHSGRDEVMLPVLSVQEDGSVLIGTAGDTRKWFVYRPGLLQPRR